MKGTKKKENEVVIPSKLCVEYVKYIGKVCDGGLSIGRVYRVISSTKIKTHTKLKLQDVITGREISGEYDACNFVLLKNYYANINEIPKIGATLQVTMSDYTGNMVETETSEIIHIAKGDKVTALITSACMYMCAV